MRAALSVVANLAEGSAKASVKDRVRFYAIALASFRESQAMLDVIGASKLLENSDFLGACLYKLRKFTLNPESRSP